MPIDSFSESLTYYDMTDVFQIIPLATLITLENILEVVFSRQAQVDLAEAALSFSLGDSSLVDAKQDEDRDLDEATQLFNAVEITPVDLVQHFQSLDE